MGCRSGERAEVEKLLAAGADPDVQDSEYGYAPAHVVAIRLDGKYLDGWTKGRVGTQAIKNDRAILQLLVETGARMDLKDHHGWDVEALLKRFNPFQLEDLISSE